MLIVALVLAAVGLSALVAAVLTGNELLAWVCIAASAVGVLLLIVDAIRERQSRRQAVGAAAEEPTAVIEEPVVEETTATIEESAAEEPMLEETTAVIEEGTSATAETAEDGELAAEIAAEEHPEEAVHDEPEYDTYSDDEPDYPAPAEEEAVHVVEDGSVDGSDGSDEAGEIAAAEDGRNPDDTATGPR